LHFTAQQHTVNENGLESQQNTTFTTECMYVCM